MAKDYSQPLCIRSPHPRRFAACYEERGYLPALEPVTEEQKEEIVAPSSGLGYSQLLREMQQLKGMLNFLEGKINEHIDKPKRKKANVF